MTIKQKMKKNQIRKLYKILDLLPDKLILNLQYYATVGRKLNLSNPKRFTEKIHWYKLNYQTPLMTKCADKYRVRDYIEDKGYSDLLPELYCVCDSYNQIDFNGLPNSYAIKCNNGSGTNVFITNKYEADFNAVQGIVKSWSKVKTISVGREWAYKNITQKIIIEELLIPTDDFQKKNGINDYKILCFNGKPQYVWVDVGRFKNFRRSFYDLNWKKLDVISNRRNSNDEVRKPDGFEKMLEIATEFSQDFPFVRVDFYSVNQKIYIGELTFYPWSGCVQFEPDEFDYELGRLFELPPVIREKDIKFNEK